MLPEDTVALSPELQLEASAEEEVRRQAAERIFASMPRPAWQEEEEADAAKDAELLAERIDALEKSRREAETAVNIFNDPNFEDEEVTSAHMLKAQYEAEKELREAKSIANSVLGRLLLFVILFSDSDSVTELDLWFSLH